MRTFSEQEIIRREKLDEIRKNRQAYPDRYEVTHSLKEASVLEDGTTGVKVAGRIVFVRNMGKLSFLKLRDIDSDFQISFKKDLLGEEEYNFFNKFIDIGDFIGVEGEIFTTHTGEKTLRANSFKFLGKALKPLPEKFLGLSDQELKYRQRYVDLITNEETRDRFKTRFLFIREVRNYLDSHGYYEIETPILTTANSGAAARPFLSHHNALDIDVYLRIAPEMYLKRAVVAGINKVYEIARCFRNEGMDATHLQDFTMMEVYQAYFNYKDNMKFIRELLQHIIQKIFGTLTLTIDGKEIDFSGEWPTYSFRDLVMKYSNIDINIYDTKEKLLAKIKEDNIELDSDTPIENLGEPIYLTEHPISLSPLARANDDNKQIADRFQLVINGAEVVNAYSELVDPIEQEEKLLNQLKLKNEGDEEAMDMDYDYISAMEYGMPPISGWGLGIDRMVQLLTNADNIKDVVMFPLMRPEK